MQTEAAGEQNDEAAQRPLAKAFGVQDGNGQRLAHRSIWGRRSASKAIQALIVFLVLVALVMALYFRTWKMAVAGLVALLHDLVITVGHLRAVRVRDHAVVDDRLPHDPRVLALRHGRRLRQGPREHRRGVRAPGA